MFHLTLFVPQKEYFLSGHLGLIYNRRLCFFFFFSEIGQCNHNSEGWTVTVKGKSIELSICRKPGQHDFSPFFLSATLFPLQHNMAGRHFSVKHYVCHFIKLQMAFEMHFLCISFCGWGRSFLSRPGGPLCFIRRGVIVGRGGAVRGARQLFVGLGVLRFCWLLIWFFSWCWLFQRVLAGAKRGLVSFSSPFSLLCFTQY